MTTTQLIAYHGDKTLRTRTLRKISEHRRYDRIAKGAYVRENGKKTFCAVGCLLEDPDGGHMRYESEFGIPAQLAYLEDGIFESLPDKLALDWPRRFMGAISVGADLSNAWPEFAIWLMVDEKWGIANVTEDAEVKAICQRVADGYRQQVDGSPLSDADADALAWAARDARAARAARDARAARAARAARDAWAARDARAARDAWDARDARAARAAWAARAARAARDAWDARDARDARDAFVIASADKLIELLEAGVPR